MKKLYFFLILACSLPPVMGQSVYWQQEVNYTIDVRLDDGIHTLDGFLKLQYINHSPDTLTYIWFHLWPNAYKNDKTAFSDQLLQNGRTDFYFSAREERGYINRLDFRVNNSTLRTEDHPQYIDVVKVYLPAPLLPGEQTVISTPFHVQLPKVFSRSGHLGHAYNITQWYPKPAVYDKKGWHAMPYLDQGEFYSEFGSFDVRITLPSDYVVAATGELQEGDGSAKSEAGGQKSEVRSRNEENPKPEVRNTKKGNTKVTAAKKQTGVNNKQTIRSGQKPATGSPQPIIKAPVTFKTLRYVQNNVHDFAWFANKDFSVQQDTLQLPSGRIIKTYTYFAQKNEEWKNHSMAYLKDAVRFRSSLIGEYPYNVVSVVLAGMGFNGGMEYPTITNISPVLHGEQLDKTIEHEVGHNWFYGILGSNERDNPWMDEGLNAYYDTRYEAMKYGAPRSDLIFPEDWSTFFLNALIAEKKDQPVAIPAAEFAPFNYGVIAYGKTAHWMHWMEDSLGTARLDAAMQQYYRQWQFKHPAPEDLQESLEKSSGQSLNTFFSALHTTGSIPPAPVRKKIRPALFFSFKDYEHTQYINFLPLVGYNVYDRFMIGGMIHNFSKPASKFQFMVAPLYAASSKELNGLGRLSYTWYPGGKLQKVTLGVSGARFSTLRGLDSTGATVIGGYNKIVPGLRVTFANKNARSTVEKWLEWKTFLIGERAFDYKTPVNDSVAYPVEKAVSHRYLNQLTFNITDYRALYPYDVQLQVQQGKDFYRVNATANYFFNYAKGGGMRVRVFAAKFGYLGAQTGAKEQSTEMYRPRLTAVGGSNDYTYSNYFIGRNRFYGDGLASQQIMSRDGDLKIRNEVYAAPPSASDNWVAAVNFNTTLPQKLFPVKLPLRLFLDVGTYAESWKKDAEFSKFLYVGGLQVTLFKELVNIYMPIVYSKAFRDNLKTEGADNTFWKRLSFSIDIQRLNLRKVTGNIAPL